MKILQKGTLTPIGWIRPEALSVDLEERSGRATMTVGPDEPKLTIGDWLLDDEEPAAGIVWRVSGIEMQWETRTWRYTLEHIVNTLQDQIIFGELDLSGTAANAAAQLLARSGGIWALGGCEYGVNLPYAFDGETLYDALETISDTLPDCVWEFDLSSLPFKLFFRNKPVDKICEMRAGRNLRTLRQSEDRNGMITRFYPIGKEDMRITGEYLSRNEDVFGTIEKSETNQSIDSEEMLRAWGDDKIRRHCVPTVTISVTGLELADATGEDLDRIRPGRMCQVPLPGTGLNINERVVRVSWRDKKKNPEDITATLANRVTDVATIIRKEVTGSSSTAKKGGRAGSKKAKEDHAWFTDTEDHVAMTAEAIIGKDPSGKVNWSRVANLSVDGGGIHATVTETKNGLVEAQSRIDQTEKSISLVVDAKGNIKAAQIVAAINNGESSILLSANHIDIDGLVKSLAAKNVTVNSLVAGSVRVAGPGGHTLVDVATVPYVNGSLYDLRVVSAGSNSYKIQKRALGDSGSWADIPNTTFSRAVASARWTWSGGAANVTLSPQRQSFRSPAVDSWIKQGNPSYNNSTKLVSQNFVITDENGDTVKVMNFNISAQAAYDAGAGSGTGYTMYKAVGTDDKIYRGNIYDSRGNKIGENYFWYGCASNIGSGERITVRA